MKQTSSEPSPPQREGGRWAIAHRATGSLTIAEASLSDVRVVLLSAVRVDSPVRLRRRIRDLLEEAHRTPDPPKGRRPVPPVMQRVVQSLLEWTEEIQAESPAAELWALAFLHSTAVPVVAHLGGEEPRFETESGALTPQSFLLRGEAGGQARALCLRPGTLPKVLMTWSTGERPSGAAAVEAEWQFEPRDDDRDETSDQAPEADSETALATEPSSEGRGITDAPVEAVPAAEPETSIAPEASWGGDEVVGAAPEQVAEPEASIAPEVSWGDDEVEEEAAPAAEPETGVEPEASWGGDEVAAEAPAVEPETSIEPEASWDGDEVVEEAVGTAEPETSIAPEVSWGGDEVVEEETPAAEPEERFETELSWGGAEAAEAPAEAEPVAESEQDFVSRFVRNDDPLDVPEAPAEAASAAEAESSSEPERSRTADQPADAPAEATSPAAPSSWGFAEGGDRSPEEEQARDRDPWGLDDDPDAAERDLLEAILADADDIPSADFATRLVTSAPTVDFEDAEAIDERGSSWSDVGEESESPGEPIAEGFGRLPLKWDPDPIETLPEPAGEDAGVPVSGVHEVEEAPRSPLEQGQAPSLGAAPGTLSPALDHEGSAAVDGESAPAASPFVPPGISTEIPDAWLKSSRARTTPRPARPLISTVSPRHAAPVIAASPAPEAKPERSRPRRPRIRPETEVSDATGTVGGAKERQGAGAQRAAIALGVVFAVVLVVWGGLKLSQGGGSRGTASKAGDHTGGAAGTALVGAVGLTIENGAAASDSGQVQVQASAVEGSSTKAAKGGEVWIDGKLRGSMPLALQLPGGPHSVRTTYDGEEAPVKVINLPAGGSRTVSFSFGEPDDHRPRLGLLGRVEPSLLDRVVTITAFLDGIQPDDLKDMHLDLRTGGAWHRFPMTLIPASEGMVGVAVVPADMVRPLGTAQFFVTATGKKPDEQYFTEIQNPDSP